MMLFDSKPEPTRISLQLPDQPMVVISRKKRRRASESSSRAAYHFDTDAEADARDAALTAVASLAGRVDEALRRLDADEEDLNPVVPVLREAVAPYLENGAAVAHDALWALDPAKAGGGRSRAGRPMEIETRSFQMQINLSQIIV